MSASTHGPERYVRAGQTAGRRLELWIRPGATGEDGVGHLVSQARSLEREGYVDEVDVREWDTYLDLSSSLQSHREREERAHLQTLKRWAWQHGRNLVGFGDRRVAGRGRMGPEYVTQRVPRALLAEYADGVLVNVTPCRGETRCVTERLDTLEAETADHSALRSRIIR